VKNTIALTAPAGWGGDIRFDELFSLEDIQRVQDAFSAAIGVSSVIVDPQGHNLTQVSNSDRLCHEHLLSIPAGKAACRQTTMELIEKTKKEASLHYCLGCGLLDAGSGIFVGERQIAVWMIGHIIDGSSSEDEIAARAEAIGVDRAAVLQAMRESPHFSAERVRIILNLMNELTRQLSAMALQRVQQAYEAEERRRQDESLRETNARLETLIQAIPDVIFFKDAAGRNQVVNRAYEKLLRLPREAIIGRFDEDILPPTLVEQCRISDLETITARAPRRFEELIAGEDGATGYLETIKAPILDEQGQVAGLVGVSRDVTDRRLAEQARDKLERQLRQSQRLEAVGRLAGGIAHDFNNIMTGINGYAEMILSTLDPNSDLYQDLEEIRKAGERAARLTNQLLAFSRKQIHAPRIIRLNEIVTQSEAGLARLLGDDVELEIATEPELWNVKADPNQIHEILLNLTANAREAMPDGGRVLIYTGNAELTGEKTLGGGEPVSGKFVQLSVSDNGRGIEPDIRDFIFEPFFTTKSKEQGGGLGLATVYGIVTQNKGHLKFFSEVGLGATFVIYLPAFESANEADETSAPPQLPEGDETVMLLADEPIIHQLAKRILENHGYRVLEPADGSEAVAIADRLPGEIHLLLADEVTLTIRGERLPETLRQSRPGLKTLIMEGAPSRMAGLNEGKRADTITIQKPFTVETLLRKVRQALDS